MKRARQAELPQLAEIVYELVILPPLNLTLADILARIFLFDKDTAGCRMIIFASAQMNVWPDWANPLLGNVVL